MTSINSVSRLEDRMKDCVAKGKIEEARIMNRDSFGAAHRIMVRGKAESFLAGRNDEKLLRKRDLEKPKFIEKVRMNLIQLLKADLGNHVLFSHLKPGQSTPMVEEALYWNIETSAGGRVQLPQEVADAIFQEYDFLHNLSPEAHRLFPIFLDGYSLGHASRVSIYTVLEAKKIKDPYHEIIKVAKGGFRHDNGKMETLISALVRLPRKLSKDEYEKVKTHPVIGAAIWEKMLNDVKSASGGIVDDMMTFNAILEHHLRPDGKGYPAYLDGTNNSLIGKMVALADSFDAMTSKRDYDVPRPDPLGYAREELKRCSMLEWDKTKTDKKEPEHQFDADLVQNFLDLDLVPVLRKAA